MSTIVISVLYSLSRLCFVVVPPLLSNLVLEDLDRELDLTSAGPGKMSLGAFITVTSVIHPSNHIGEISCLKGLQGRKGYPV